MSTKHLHRKPHKIRGTSTAWWYEEAKGVCVVVEHWEAGNHICTDSTTIPWKSLEGALARKAQP